jgi:hypothetical protein
VLLRDIHCALLRCIEGTVARADGTVARGELPDAPRAASMTSPDSRSDQWQERVSLALLRGSAELVLPGGYQAAMALQLHDYMYLSTDQRVAALKRCACGGGGGGAGKGKGP